MADEFELKGNAALCAGGQVTMPPQTARDAATIIRAYISIANGLEISRDAYRIRAETAEISAAASAAMVAAIERLSLLGLFFFWLGRARK